MPTATKTRDFLPNIWRDEHILSNISRDMRSRTKNHGRDDTPFYAPQRDGGKRANSGSHRRLLGISKATSAAMRHRKFPGMDEKGWVPMQCRLSLRAMLQLGAKVHDVYDIVEGEGENAKFRFELSSDKCTIRCVQRHSVGGGVRPDCLPVAPNVQYAIHGTSLSASKRIAKEGLSRWNRLHIHFYERDKHGHIIVDQDVRCGSDAAILISDKQFRDDGIGCYRPSNNVILSEGIDGVIGAQYFRFIHRLHRDPTRRKSILRHMEGWAGDESEDSDRQKPHKISTRANVDEAMPSAVYDLQTADGMQTVASEDCPDTPVLNDIAGLNPFPPAGSESACSKIPDIGRWHSAGSDGSETMARMAEDESYSPPYPANMVKREAKTKEECAEPTFATHKLNLGGKHHQRRG